MSRLDEKQRSAHFKRVHRSSETKMGNYVSFLAICYGEMGEGISAYFVLFFSHFLLSVHKMYNYSSICISLSVKVTSQDLCQKSNTMWYDQSNNVGDK